MLDVCGAGTIASAGAKAYKSSCLHPRWHRHRWNRRGGGSR